MLSQLNSQLSFVLKVSRFGREIIVAALKVYNTDERECPQRDSRSRDFLMVPSTDVLCSLSRV